MVPSDYELCIRRILHPNIAARVTDDALTRIGETLIRVLRKELHIE